MANQAVEGSHIDEVCETLKGVKQYYVNVDDIGTKFDTFVHIYNPQFITKSVIFVNSRAKADLLINDMRRSGYSFSAVYGGMDQNTIKINISEFNYGLASVLITTDLFAGDIDVQKVSLVINHDFPTHQENYLSRVGPFPEKCITVNFVTKDDEKMLSDIQMLYNVVIEDLPLNFSKLL